VHLGPQSILAVGAKSDLTQRPKFEIPASLTTTYLVSLHLVQFIVPPKSQIQKLGQKVLLRTHLWIGVPVELSVESAKFLSHSVQFVVSTPLTVVSMQFVH